MVTKADVVHINRGKEEAATSPSLFLAQFLEDWLWSKQGLRPSTHAAYEIHVRRFLTPGLGHIPLDRLTHRDISAFYRTSVAPEVSIATMRRIHATLRAALSSAVREGLIDRNPAGLVELPAQPRIEQACWSAAELQHFLAVTTDHQRHALYVLLGVLGLRRGEAVALVWRDVDLEAGTLRVRNAAVRVGARVHVGPPKSRHSVRTLAVDARTIASLARVRASGADEDLLFPGREGGLLDPSAVSREFDRLQRLHGMRRIRLHDLRHTSASIGLAAGESLFEVSRRLGHSSITVTADIYSHLMPGTSQANAERMASVIYGQAGPR